MRKILPGRHHKTYSAPRKRKKKKKRKKKPAIGELASTSNLLQ